MTILLIGLSIFSFVLTDKGNDNPSWEFIGENNCNSGESNTGFAFTVGGKVFFKQKNLDGTIGKICEIQS